MRLSYADCDPAGIIYYAAWFVAMERTLTEWFFGHGIRFDTIKEELGCAPVTRSTWCEYLVAASVYDSVDIELRVSHIGRSSYTLGFAMTRQSDGARLAQSGITCVLVGQDGRPTAIPAPFRLALESEPPR